MQKDGLFILICLVFAACFSSIISATCLRRKGFVSRSKFERETSCFFSTPGDISRTRHVIIRIRAYCRFRSRFGYDFLLRVRFTPSSIRSTVSGPMEADVLEETESTIWSLGGRQIKLATV